MSFQLDTSGYVGPVDLPNGTQALAVSWGHLSPFCQGYVEAMFADYQARVHGDADAGLAFSDLSRSALALILERCAAYEAGARAVGLWEGTADQGRDYWRFQQQPGRDYPFDPVTISLDEEGKVQLSVKGG